MTPSELADESGELKLALDGFEGQRGVVTLIVLPFGIVGLCVCVRAGQLLLDRQFDGALMCFIIGFPLAFLGYAVLWPNEVRIDLTERTYRLRRGCWPWKEDITGSWADFEYVSVDCDEEKTWRVLLHWHKNVGKRKPFSFDSARKRETVLTTARETVLTTARRIAVLLELPLVDEHGRPVQK